MKELKLGVQIGYFGAQPTEDIIGIAQEAENIGYDSIWTAEAWGSDVFTPLSWIGAHTSKIRLGTGIAQLSARTPAATRSGPPRRRSREKRGSENRSVCS